MAIIRHDEYTDTETGQIIVHNGVIEGEIEDEGFIEFCGRAVVSVKQPTADGRWREVEHETFVPIPGIRWHKTDLRLAVALQQAFRALPDLIKKKQIEIQDGVNAIVQQRKSAGRPQLHLPPGHSHHE